MRWRLAASVALVVILAIVTALTQSTRTVWPAHRYNIADGVFRAVVLGDSVGHGAGDETGRGLTGWLDVELQIRAIDAIDSLNLAFNGARTFHVASRLREPRAREAIARADVIVLSIGGNDLYGDSRVRFLTGLWPWYQRYRTLERIVSLVHTTQRLNPDARIYLLGLYNPYRQTGVGRWVDTQVNLWDGGLIEQLAAEENVTVVRIADLLRRTERLSPIDRFHPGSRGYSAIARSIADTF